MPPRLRPLVLAAAVLLAGCADRADAPESPLPSRVDVRAVFLGTVFDGQAATFDHEAIPGVMDAMRMDLPLAEPGLLDGIPEGSPVALALETEPRLRVVGVERLPDGTALDLAGAAPATPDPAAADPGAAR